MPIKIFYTKLITNNQYTYNNKCKQIQNYFTFSNHKTNQKHKYNTQLGKKLLIETIKAVLPDFNANELYYINGHPQCKRVWLSLSYSRYIIIAAASTTHKIGIDIECVVPIEIDQYLNELSKEEKAFLSQSNNNLLCFYYIWTRKEAILKACGYGLQYPLSDLNTLQTNISLIISPIRWYVTSLIICPKYMFSCALDSAIQLPQPIELTGIDD